MNLSYLFRQEHQQNIFGAGSFTLELKQVDQERIWNNSRSGPLWSLLYS